MKKSTIFHLIFILALLLFGAWKLIGQRKINDYLIKADKVWVYVEVMVNMPNDTSAYYYYGPINESVFEQINNNSNSKGLFILSDIRYWNDDDLLEVYEDEDCMGIRVFNIQDIRQIRAYKKDPVYIYRPDELHKSAKSLIHIKDTTALK